MTSNIPTDGTAGCLQMMASLFQHRFKICFIFLLFVVCIGLVSLQVFDVFLEPSKAWLKNVARHLHSYMSINRSIGNKMLIKPPPYLHYKQTSRELETSNTTHVAVTVTSRFKATDSTDWGKKMTNVSSPDHEAYPRNYHFILDEPDICVRQKPFLVLMVPVAPQQLEARNSIRSTWGNESIVQGKNITVLFMLGLKGVEEGEKHQEQLNLESQQYHDLIQSNFMDTYKNLTIKTMVILDWLATHCPQASYAMKIDSDMFLNLENLMSLLLAPNTPKENYITGMVMWNRPVIRNEYSKWYVPKEVYPDDVYPTYLLGMGYVFSSDLPEKLVKVSKDVKPFPIEDAYVGACLKKMGLSPSSPPDPSKFKAYHSGEFKRSEFARIITTILSSPKQLTTFWQELKR
ncbi:hypothetical protein AMELA_G00001020, partial [Ameiurus melas]